MKILYVLNSGNPGGMEKHVLDLVKGMSANGHEVYVWCGDGEISEWYEDAGGIVTKKVIKFDIDPCYIFSLKKFLLSKGINVIHAHELKPSTNALIAGLLARTKVKITHVHTPMTEWLHPNLVKKMFARAEVFFYSLLVNLISSKEIALTESKKKTKIKEGVRKDKIEVIPNGLNLSIYNISREEKAGYRMEIRKKYGIPENAFVFGNVSRMTEEKGHDILIEAFVNSDKNLNDTTYVILAGGGRLEQKYKDMIREYKLEDKILISGVFSQKDLVKYYMSFDAFIFPTLAEGFGFVLIEAMYSGVPVISSDLEVLKEIAGDTINYFQIGSVSELSLQMENVRKNYSEYIKQVGKAKKLVENKYSMENFIKSYLDLYINLLND